MTKINNIKINNLNLNIDFAGYFKFGLKEIYSLEDFIELLITLKIPNKGLSYLTQYLKLFSGSWSFILENTDNNEKLAAVDRVRSRPIFINNNNNGNLNLSSKINELRTKNYFKKIPSKTFSYYQRNRISPPTKALNPNINVLRPCSYIYFKNNKKYINQYDEVPEPFLNTNNPSSAIAESIILDSLDSMYKYLIKRKEYKIFIPLSAGMDSRLIATFLAQKKELSNRIICYTYGSNIHNYESLISCSIAKNLNLRWEFIQYKSSMWKELRKNYNEVINNFPVELCCPNLQEYFASKYLAQNYGKGIFLPGYFLDGPAGNHICPDEISFLSNLFRGKYRYSRTGSKIQDWYRHFIENRVTFVLLSTVWFKSVNCDFYIPFVDNSILDFWYNLPTNKRKGRLFFKKIIKNIYEEINPKMNQIAYSKYPFSDNVFKNEFIGLKAIIKPTRIGHILKKLFLIIKKQRIKDHLGIYNIAKLNEFPNSANHYHDLVNALTLKYLRNKKEVLK